VLKQKWQGPEFLLLPEECWPNDAVQSAPPPSSEVRKSSKLDTTLSSFSAVGCDVKQLADRLDPDRYSDWKRLTRVHAWVRRFANNCAPILHRSAKGTSVQNRSSGELASDEVQESEMIVIKTCQQNSFAEEYKALMKEKPLPASSKLLALNPCLDSDVIMRSSSRLVNAEILPFETQYPIILPRRHSVTKLIVKSEHEQGAHVCGTYHILSELSKKYWVIGAIEAIREWESACMACKRRAAKVATQIMAPLPASRLQMPESLRCFVHTALDFTGPYITVQGCGRRREKRYLCLFTCMSTRAVHLEMAYGLDTDSFLNAFYHFVNRRGYPVELTSDNGRNFVDAHRELQELIVKLDHQKIVKSISSHGLKWNFNPPSAPHFGGVFEVMIKAAKRATSAILGNADVTDEELWSAFIEAEALLNSRPLTYQSSSPCDITPLTTSHFLHGELGRRAAPVPADDVRHPRTRWRRVQELVRHFWRRLMQKWLPSLSSRKKWTSCNRDFVVGDIVLVMNCDTPRGT